MKKKLFAIFTIAIIAISASAALTSIMSSWVKVSDPDCNKCIMNDLERKCGKSKCGGFMKAVDGTSKVEDGYLQYDYKCEKCGHTITYKNK